MIFDQQPKTRQELYDRIRESSKDAVVLEEMIRLGFWPERGKTPEDPAEEIHRRAELEKKLQDLRAQHARLADAERLKAELRKRRMEESKKKQRETKERREREREERARAWAAKKTGEIVFLGRNVSGGLGKTVPDAVKLAKRGLPVLGSAAEIAAALGLPVGQVRFLAFHRRVSRTSHYKTFKIPKKTGGERVISAPMPRLKLVQRWILTHILEKVELHAAAHGFRPGRSIVSNAVPHVGSDVVVNLDLKDFFPSITYRRVKGLFLWLGYPEEAATIFGLLATAPDTEEVELDGVSYHVAVSERHLPQGAPTSPAITNILCDRLDRRLTHACTKLGFTYTRYADDLTFSAKKKDAAVGKLLRQADWLVVKDGLEVHPKKTKVQRRGRRQDVTGIVVNERPMIARDTIKRFRATLFQIEKDGPKGKKWGESEDVMASIQGFANYVFMVNAEKGRVLQEKVRALHAKYGYVAAKVVPRSKAKPAPPPPASEPKKKPWWKLW
jgi:retron-type reverse transcriptase